MYQTHCEQGSDQKCLDISPESCCFFLKIAEVDENPTREQQHERINEKNLGLPIEKEEFTYICADREVVKKDFGPKQKFYDEALGFTYTGYCARAITKVGATLSILGAMTMIHSF